jgi:hypothetical protein
MTFASRFRFICWIVILSITSIGIATSQSQKSNSFTSEAVQLVRQLHDVKQLRRSAAFYLLIEKGLGQALAGRTYLIPQALTQLFRGLPDKEDEIKAALVELLEKENALIQDQHTDFLATGKTLSHEYMNYYGDLIAAVAALKDPRATNGLLGAIATGNLATRGLAALGIDALPPRP